MKKLILIGLLCLSASVIASNKKNIRPRHKETIRSEKIQIPESQYRSTLNKMLAEETTEKLLEVAMKENFWSITARKDLAELREEADKKLGERGVCKCWKYPHIWKHLSANERNKNGANKAYPKIIELALEKNVGINIHAIALKGATLEELIVCLNEMLGFPDGCTLYSPDFDLCKKGIQIVAAKEIKRALRKQGKSFVTKDGINPCEEYMEKLNKSLNSPRFNGLNEWLSELGWNVRVDTSRLPSEEKISALKDAIFYGDKRATILDKTILSICLGVDGYNEFVKKYNGD